MKKDNKYWKENLTEEEYRILRLKETEAPFTGKYDEFFERGEYYCAGCKNKLFKSENKFNSHCGWPSFDRSLEESVELVGDRSLGMERIEVVCKNCGGHLGHVFDDGPKETTGQRFCINSAALKFQKKYI